MRSDNEQPSPPLPRSAGGWGRAKGWFTRFIGSKKAALAEEPSEEAPGPIGSAGPRLTADELALVRKDLRHILDQHPESRTVMRYVRAIEHSLHKKGRHAIEEMPIDVLRLGLGQLDLLASGRRLEGLALLRSKAAVSIAERERIAAVRERNRQQEADVEVEDASHTTFLEVNEEWERSFTGQSGSVPFDDTATGGLKPLAKVEPQ